MSWKKNLSVTGTEQISRLIIQFFTVVTVSRLVEIRDFGLSALATLFLNLIATLGQIAIEPFIVKSRYLKSRLISSVWTLTIGINLALLVFVLIIHFLNLISSQAFYLSLSIISGSTCWALGSACRALMLRWKQYEKLFMVGVSGSLANAIISVSLAAQGRGAYALVIGQSSAIATSTLVAILLSTWKPKFAAPKKQDWEQILFLRDSLLFGLTTFVARNLDTILIFFSLGTVALGTYDRAYTLMVTALQVLSMSIGRIILPEFASAIRKKSSVIKNYVRASTLMSTCATLVFTPIALCSSTIVNILYGHTYLTVAPLLSVLSIAGLIQTFANPSGALYISTSQTSKLVRIGFATSLFYSVGFLFALKFGTLMSFAVSTVLSALISWLYVEFKVSQDFNISAWSQIRINSLSLLSILMVCTVYYLMRTWFGLQSQFTMLFALGFVETSLILLVSQIWKYSRKKQKEVAHIIH